MEEKRNLKEIIHIKAWHTKDADSIVFSLSTVRKNGLGSGKAEPRLSKYEKKMS